MIGRRKTNMPASIHCPKCAQTYVLKEGMAGKTVKCPKCGQAFRVSAADAPATQAGTAARSDLPVARRLTPAASGGDPAAAAGNAALDGPSGGAASETQGPDGVWESPVRTGGRAVPPPLPAPAGAEGPKWFERAYFKIAAVIMLVLGVAAIVAVVWVYQPFARGDKAPVQEQVLQPPARAVPAPSTVPKGPPPDPGVPAAPSAADKRLDELADEAIARMGELDDLLASIRDAASSRAAIANLLPLQRRVGELQRERRMLESQGARLSPQKQQQWEAREKALEAQGQQHVERLLQQAPQYLELMDELIKEVSPGAGPPKKKQP
jgi:predicted Zn finger-like uncharacterized protein